MIDAAKLKEWAEHECVRACFEAYLAPGPHAERRELARWILIQQDAFDVLAKRANKAEAARDALAAALGAAYNRMRGSTVVHVSVTAGQIREALDAHVPGWRDK